MFIKCFLLFILLTSTAFTQEITFDENPSQAILDMIATNNSCLKEVCGNRLYLKENYLFLTGSGIFLYLNEQDDYLRLPKLLSDEFGCFIETEESKLAVDILNHCPGCGRKYFVICRNPDCPLKKNKEGNG